MTNKIKKYPDGGTLPTYTTGTPEYNAYIAKQQRAKDWEARHANLLNSGYYTNPVNASKAEIAYITSEYKNVLTGENTPSGYKRYSYDSSTPAPTDIHKGADASSYISIPEKGYYYVPYYDSPGEATIVKSQADLDAEKRQAENKAFSEKYQGYVVTNVPVQREDGSWGTTQEAVPYPVGKTPPTDGTFHLQLPQGATVTQFAGGGKLGSFVGDGFKMAGDTLLSTIGLTDVIKDSAYKNQKMAEVSQLAEKNAMNIGKVAGNILLPGMGGAIVGTTQNILGNVDGEDTQREYMNKISSLQEQNALGKFNAGAYSQSKYLDPTNAILTGVGELGTAISGQGIEGMKDQFGQIKNTFQNLPIFPDGGNLDKRKEIGFTFRPAKYGTQNYFEYMDKAQREIYEKNPTLLTDQQGNTAYSSYDNLEDSSGKVGFFDSMKHSMLINKNTREQGRDFGRVKWNAFVDRVDNEIPTFGCGGSMKKYPDGGQFIEYNGPDHSNGGVPVDKNGQPTIPSQATAEVEGGETMHDDGIEKYIFSDRLMKDPKSKITFADVSKKINRKYKDTKDPFQKAARDLELNRLKQEQEQFKATISGNTQQPIMMNGGYVNKYDGGGSLQTIPEKNFDDFQLLTPQQEADLYLRSKNNYYPNQKYIPEKSTANTLNLNNNYEQIKSTVNGDFSFVPYSEEYLNSINTPSYINVTEPDPSFEEIHGDLTTIYDENGNPTNITTDRVRSIINSSNNTSNNTSSMLPEDKINPLGFVASNIGNVYDLFQSSKKGKANKFDKVNLSTINLEDQRNELRKQAGLSKDINRETVRGMATSSGQAIGNQIIGNALINSSLGSGLSQSFLNEQTANTQIKNQQELTNNQIRQSEILADQMDLAKRQSTTSGALHSIGMNTQGYVRDLKSAKVGNKNNEMWLEAMNNSSKYFKIGTDTEGNPVYQTKDGQIISKN